LLTLSRSTSIQHASLLHPETQPIVTDAEPWPWPVTGADLLDSLRTIARRFLVLPPYAENVVALWVLFTYCIDSFSIAPILAVVAPDKRCGKTT
jgi:putative DNA primase/helicase